MMRPQPAVWFEVLCAHDDAVVAAEAMGRSGVVELQTRPGTAVAGLDGAQGMVGRFADLAKRYQPYWPPMTDRPSRGLPAIEPAWQQLQAWAGAAAPLIHRLQRLGAEQAELTQWQAVIAALVAMPLDLGRLGHAGPTLRAVVVLGPPEAASRLPTAPLQLGFRCGTQTGAILLGPAREIDDLKRTPPPHCRVLDPPPWFAGDARSCAAACDARLAKCQDATRRTRKRLAALARRHALATALPVLFRLQWFAERVGGLAAAECLTWFTGWTSAPATLAAALQRSGARALLQCPPAPAGLEPPLLLRNPAWAQPYEIFPAIFGVPGAQEPDPSPLLAAVVPLLFGYMFGDLGQGLVLCLAGAWLRRYWAPARMLVGCGVSAALFGLVFGSAFALELPYAWVRPLAAPIPVLLAPLMLGGVLIAAGQLLAGVSAWWQRRTDDWLADDAGVLLLYLGALTSIGYREGGWLMAAGALALLVGPAWRHRSPVAALRSVGALAEKLPLLLTNTLSFARVGAFALAHAGLSAALVALSGAAGNRAGQFLVLVAGNALVLVLEGLLVAVQTTRLVLFEFFSRFLRGEGRAFRPLAAPPGRWEGGVDGTVR